MKTESAELLAQRFMVGFPGVDVPPEVKSLIEAGLGGVILFRRNLPDLDTAFGLLGELARLGRGRPLLLAVDQEGGRVQRLGPPVLQLPPMRVLGARGDEELCRRAGRQLGAELCALGFHLDLAPVLDVDSNPENPVIGDRAFASAPAAVSRLGLAFADGLRAAGVAACAKHFPGHGDTDVDSHRALPRLRHSRARLEAVELAPFRAAVDLDTCMLAHLLVDALDPDRPSSLSQPTVQLLREELGFGGLILTDDLEMGALAGDVVGASLEALRAGSDLLLVCHQPALAAEAIARAEELLAEGGLSRPALEASRRRHAALAARVGAGHRAPDRAEFAARSTSAARVSLERDLVLPEVRA